MSTLSNKIALVTGGSRGLGREMVLAFAAAGADVVIASRKLEACEAVAREVEKLGRRALPVAAHVGKWDDNDALAARAYEQFGRVDIVIPNAGICSGAKTWEISPEDWREMIDINLNGVFHTVKAAVPTLIAQNEGGSIVFIGSTEALKGAENISSYAASKHGVTGLMTSLARELGQYGIRVNSVNPTCVDTHMINNDFVYGLFRPDLDKPTRADVVDTFTGTHILPVPWIDPSDVSNAILYLVTEPGRYITATTLVIDAGFIVKS